MDPVSKDGELGGFSEIDAKQTESTIELLPLGVVKGKVMNKATGKPEAKVKVQYRAFIYDKAKKIGSTAFGDSTETDEEGNFQFRQVIQGRKYSIQIGDDRGYVSDFTLNSGETLDLGNLPNRK